MAEMTPLQKIRAQVPEYQGMSDIAVARDYHQKYYPDKNFAEVLDRLGARHSWSELPGNIAPSVGRIGEGIAHQVMHPVETLNAYGDLAQGAVDRLLPDSWTDYLDRTATGRTRTVDEKAKAKEVSGQFGQDMVDRFGGIENIRNTIITDPAGAALDALSVADPALRMTRRVITPNPSNAVRRAAANTLRDEGVDLTAGQRSGNRRLQMTESELGSGAEINQRQASQFTRAALKRAGIDADLATTEVMKQAAKDFGAEYDGLAARNVLLPDRTLINDLRNVANDYDSGVGSGNRVPFIRNSVDDFIKNLTAPQARSGVSGRLFQKEVSDLARRARAAGSNPEYQHALYALREALTDAMERSVQVNNPRDLGAWRDVNNRYRNFIAIEDAVGRAGGAGGIISPQQLAGAVKVKQGKRNYTRGQGDFSDLAHAGEVAMPRMPDSGTSMRTWATHALGGMMGGAGGYGAGGGLTGAGALAALGAVLGPSVAGKVLMNPLMQKYLGNQAWLGRGRIMPRAVTTGARLGSASTAQERNRQRMIRMLER